MKFVQIVEYKTSKPDEAQKIIDQYLAATEGKRLNGHGTTGRDRDQANTYMNIVEFASYEDAMKNSELPETATMASAMMQICDGPPAFRNLDVIFES